MERGVQGSGGLDSCNGAAYIAVKRGVHLHPLTPLNPLCNWI